MRSRWARVSLGAGWAETPDGLDKYLRVGDRMVPAHLDVHFESDGVQPSLELHLEVVDGIPQCRELRILSAPAGREIKTLDLAAVTLREWVEEALRALRLGGRRQSGWFRPGRDGDERC